MFVSTETLMHNFDTMVRRRRSTSQSALPHTDEPQLNLRLHASGERLHTLQKERERLLRDVQRKKFQLQQTLEKAQASAHAALEKLTPIIAQHDVFRLELKALFDELLAPGRLSASARKKVAKVRQTLEDLGLLSNEEEHLHAEANCDEDLYGSFDDDDHPFGPAPKQPFSGHSPREVASATPRGQGTGHESLRVMFKRLALIVHPDRAAHEPDRLHRTEIMKQVTQAYQDGDLARLLELEDLVQGGATPSSSSDAETRCRDLERVIRELRAQATELGRELRMLKKSTMLVGTVNAVIASAEAEFDELKTVCAFVKSFRDGKISLAEFVRGPEMKDDDDTAIEALLAHFVAETFGANPAPAMRREQSGAKRGRPRKR